MHIHARIVNIHLPTRLALSQGIEGEYKHFANAARAATASLVGDTPAPGELWKGQGGFYVGSWPAMLGLPARHVIAHEEEIESITYGGYGQDEPGAASRVDGPANTRALLTSTHEHPAAQWCAARRADGHADFHLPAQADLFLAMLMAPQLFKKEGWYQSSTQGSAVYAVVQDFAIGNSHWGGKGDKFRGRAFRWIQL